MKAVRMAVMLVMTAALLIILFFTALQVGIFSMRYVDREMDKLDIARQVGMEPKDLHDLFKETLAYLSDDREDLVIQTVVEGEAREAYNEQEKLHMVDVKELFMGGFRIRNSAIAAALLCLGVVLLLKKNSWKDWIRELTGCLLICWGLFLAVVLIAVGFIAVDFNKYFILFHHIFFDNDLWLLDPRTSLMINMLPETFFYDTVIRIVCCLLIPYGVIMVGCAGIRYRLRRKKVQ